MEEKKKSKLLEKIKKFFKTNKNDDSTFSFGEVSIIILCTTIISILVGILLDKNLFRSENKYSNQLKELIEKFKGLNPKYDVSNLTVIDSIEEYNMKYVVGKLNGR